VQIEQHEERSTVTSRGQLVIPASLRKKLGIGEGTQVVIWEQGGQLILQPITSGFVRNLRGALREHAVGTPVDSGELPSKQ
jgi:AbrB family looped-hinge helix DNA binding protein